jgi:hypothetical protein
MPAPRYPGDGFSTSRLFHTNELFCNFRGLRLQNVRPHKMRMAECGQRNFNQCRKRKRSNFPSRLGAIGNIYRTGGPGEHQIMRGSGKGAGLSSANTVGMEIIARDDADVTRGSGRGGKGLHS